MPNYKAKEESKSLTKFINYGLIDAEIKEYLQKEFCDDGFSSVRINHHGLSLQIFLAISKPSSEVVGVNKCRIKLIKSLIAKRLKKDPSEIEFYTSTIKKRALCPVVQAATIRSKLQSGFTATKAVYEAMRTSKFDGAKGIQIILSGKLRGQRARSTKYRDSVIIHSGHPSHQYVRTGFDSVLLRQGVIGIEVKIMLPNDPEGQIGPSKPMPDFIKILDVKE